MFMFPPAMYGRIQQVAAASGVSVFMVLNAGLAVLLNKLGAGEDIVVATPTAGRGDDALDDLVEFFVNTLVLRTDLTGNPSFTDLVRRTRETALNAYSHQDIPFDALVDVLAPERSLAHTPIYQVMLAWAEQPSPSHRSCLVSPPPPCQPPPEPLAPTSPLTSVSPLTLTGTLVWRYGSEYRTDLFDQDTITRWMGMWRWILDQLVADPDLPVGLINPLSAVEQDKILSEFNATGVASPLRC